MVLNWTQAWQKRREGNTSKYLAKRIEEKWWMLQFDARYTAQVLGRFQRVVSASNLQDKDLVLSYLYVPGSQTKRKIKNSVVCSDLAETSYLSCVVLVWLLTSEIIGKSDDEISALAKSNPCKNWTSKKFTACCKLRANNDAERWLSYKSWTASNCHRTWNNIGMVAFQGWWPG